MTITTLKNSPHLLSSTLSLIEKAFQYRPDHKFEVDFFPLMDQSNHHNCFVMIDESETVLGHIGALEKTLGNQPVCMLGGIAVDESRRGEGIFQKLMLEVLAEKRSENCLFLLWSNMERMYQKFGFHLCGLQIEVPPQHDGKSFEATKLRSLSAGDKQQVREIYHTSFASTYLTLNRTLKDWDQLEHITSADLYLRRENGKIQSYFFMNKGQDLPGVIYEYGTLGSLTSLLQELRGYGKIWLGTDLMESPETQYQFLLCPGETRRFAEFIKSYTQDTITIRDINLMKQEVYFDFNQETLALSIEEFLRGVLGPGRFEEIEDKVKPIFISGLESI